MSMDHTLSHVPQGQLGHVTFIRHCVVEVAKTGLYSYTEAYPPPEPYPQKPPKEKRTFCAFCSGFRDYLDDVGWGFIYYKGSPFLQFQAF